LNCAGGVLDNPRLAHSTDCPNCVALLDLGSVAYHVAQVPLCAKRHDRLLTWRSPSSDHCADYLHHPKCSSRGKHEVVAGTVAKAGITKESWTRPNHHRRVIVELAPTDDDPPSVVALRSHPHAGQCACRRDLFLQRGQYLARGRDLIHSTSNKTIPAAHAAAIGNETASGVPLMVLQSV
jgi:hypothetical protein